MVRRTWPFLETAASTPTKTCFAGIGIKPGHIQRQEFTKARSGVKIHEETCHLHGRIVSAPTSRCRCRTASIRFKFDSDQITRTISQPGLHLYYLWPPPPWNPPPACIPPAVAPRDSSRLCFHDYRLRTHGGPGRNRYARNDQNLHDGPGQSPRDGGRNRSRTRKRDNIPVRVIVAVIVIIGAGW